MYIVVAWVTNFNPTVLITKSSYFIQLPTFNSSDDLSMNIESLLVGLTNYFQIHFLTDFSCTQGSFCTRRTHQVISQNGDILHLKSNIIQGNGSIKTGILSFYCVEIPRQVCQLELLQNIEQLRCFYIVLPLLVSRCFHYLRSSHVYYFIF